MYIDENEYLNVREFAEKVGCTKQAVYKRMNDGELTEYTKEIGGKKYISISAIGLFRSAVIEKNDNTADNDSSVNDSSDDTQATENMNEQKQEGLSESELVTILKSELECKNRQIDELNKRLAEINKQNTELNKRLAELAEIMSNQQRLAMADKQLLLESRKDGVFARLFGKRKG